MFDSLADGNIQHAELNKYQGDRMSEELRNQFEIETFLHWENDQGEPDIEYVEWLERKLNTRPDKPMTKAMIGELFLIAKPVLRIENGKYEIDVKDTIEAIHATLPDHHELLGALHIAKEALERIADEGHRYAPTIAADALVKMADFSKHGE
jgi:hypothetical protein